MLKIRGIGDVIMPNFREIGAIIHESNHLDCSTWLRVSAYVYLYPPFRPSFPISSLTPLQFPLLSLNFHPCRVLLPLTLRSNMQTPPSLQKISVTWRGKKFVVEMNLNATVKELGQELQKLTNIQEDTMRLIVPQISSKTSKLLAPFSTEHALLSLLETSITETRSIKMMGVSTNEVEEVLQNAKANLRIAGFEDEEKRMKQRISYGPRFSLKLPQGQYVFCEFRTLEIPGVELNPPPSEALKRMHMLAADPGIVAVMNKHRWCVGIMTEMAPIGYVGVSPKCLLGFNKNHGEEISLRVRTDDLKGFRKYESIKKTLLHELAHMIYSEHDANFYALDKQLNQEAASLDWTRSASHTLSGVRNSDVYEEEFITDSSNIPQKLGGNRTDQLISARESSVAAAYHRMVNVSANKLGGSEVNQEPDPDYFGFNTSIELDIDVPILAEKGPDSEPDPDDHLTSAMKHEPDPDDSHLGNAVGYDICSGITDSRTAFEQKASDFDLAKTFHAHTSNVNLDATDICKEPDPDDSETSLKSAAAAESNCSLEMSSPDRHIPSRMDTDRPAIDDFEAENLKHGNSMLLDSVGSMVSLGAGHQVNESLLLKEHAHDQSRAQINVKEEPDPDDVVTSTTKLSMTQTDEPDPDDQEFQRINDPVTAVCNRLQKALEMLRGEVSPMQNASILQTLLKIIRNVIEHPEEEKYKRLRKANPVIERNIINCKAALEILFLVGFSEDDILDNHGKAEAYLVLKRNDPGLLWLAKSTLESCTNC